MNETWKPIPEWQGMYEVSDQGRVRSLPRVVEGRYLDVGRALRPVPGRILKPGTTADGYLRVWLMRENVRTQMTVHRAVCLAFHGVPAEGQVVRHLDDVKTHNTPDNLLWGTRSENTYDKVRNGLHPMASKTHCKRGHVFDAENTVLIHNQRRCRECHNALRRDARKARNAA